MEGRVLFLGEKSAEEIREFYATSTIVVLPSYSEGLSRVILEAQSMAKPVVAYEIGAMSDIVLPDETGFLVRTGDINALADKLALLLENETACVRMGRRGRQFVSTAFSITSLLQRHEAFYLGALAKAQGRS
jgi:glycosyltransferase involved in cell wall biosynthesis